MKTYYSSKPAEITYMTLPDGRADVWLRKNIAEEETEDGPVWTADEIYFRTLLSMEAIEADFDALYNADWEIELEEETTLEARVEQLEANQDYIAMMTGIDLEV